MHLMFIKAFKINKRYLFATAFLVFLALPVTMYLDAGAARESQAVLAWPVVDKVIVVDPGHGGFDPGVVGKNGVMEKDINLAIGKRLAAELKQAGATVLMTRETDSDLSEPGTTSLLEKKQEDLKKRVALANEHKADLLISIHVNSHSSEAPRGAQTFVQPGFSESKRAGQIIQSELTNFLKNTDRLTKEADYYITRNTSIPAVLVETGFITNASESRLLQDPAYQGKVSRAIYAGIARYFAAAAEAGAPYYSEEVIKVFKEQTPGPLGEP
ncbi:MAG: Germination-specific N-acetylmuramoyl-L-alanine amidase precursor [Pelotomaculum sp. PtaU1.Bin065]|nr:MAG: Germination-specific N-acetylmuramoyl-L-alanine amidase precursor [Pelotomaculum sp. PtaU1.Bin065]